MSARRVSGAEAKRPHDGATPHPGLISLRPAPPKRPLRAARLRHRCSPQAMRLCMCHHAFTSPGITPQLSVHVAWDGRRDWIASAAVLSELLTSDITARACPFLGPHFHVHPIAPRASSALSRLEGVSDSLLSSLAPRETRRFSAPRFSRLLLGTSGRVGQRGLVRLRRFR